MDYVPLTMDLTFSDTIPNVCVDLTTIFNAGANGVSFNVNLTTTEPPTAVILSPLVTNITILDGRQFSSSVFHSLNFPQYKEKINLCLSLPPSLPHTHKTLVVVPTIVTPPMSIENAFPDTTVNFTVVAEGGALSYQWSRDGVIIRGATRATLTLVDVTIERDEGTYSCFIYNLAGNITTDDVSLTVCKYTIM